MSWAKYDDGYDDSTKVRKALRHGVLGLAAIGLHTLGVTQSARRETDGLVDIDWLDEKLHRLSTRDRQRLMKVMTDVGFFEELPVGEARTLRDTKGYEVTVGPLTEPAHLVHDFLDYNDSSAYMADKRRKDSERKRPGLQSDSERNPNGIQTDSARIPSEPRARGRVPDPTRPDPTRPDPSSRRQADEPDSSPEVSVLCDLLAHLMLANDPKAKVAPESVAWRKPARLLLEKDERPFEEAQRLLRWCQSDSFWRSNVLSMEKFREKYGQLLLKAQERGGAQDGRALSSHQAGMQQARRFMEMAAQAGKDAA